MMEVALDGAVRGSGAEAVAGLLGNDALHRVVLELVAPSRAPGDPRAPPVTAVVHRPESYAPHAELSWAPLTFVEGVPHVAAGFDVEEEGGLGEGGVASAAPALREAEVPGGTSCSDHALFALNLGVGGVSVVLSARAQAQLMLAQRLGMAARPGGVVTGAGERRGRLADVQAEEAGGIVTGRLAKVDIAGAHFEYPRVLCHVGRDPPDAQVSPHAAGTLCADLFRGCHVVLDFPGGRMSVTRT